MKKICIIGVGYVGLTLGVVLADRGFEVVGYDTDKNTIKKLQSGQPTFYEKGIDILLKKHLNKNFRFTNKIVNDNFDAFIISVGTPFDNKAERPVLDHLINGTKEVATMLTDDSLVVVRSTVPVGATRDVVKPLLDKTGKKYFLAFCPERTAEGVALKELLELPQIIGGLDNASVEKAFALFRKITPTIVEVESLEAAEMIKLINNCYRDLNFAFANEIALICERLRLNPFKTISAANLGYSRSNVSKPGLTGGTCLRKDPYILADFAKRNGYEAKLITVGRNLNEYIPTHIAKKIYEHTINTKKECKQSKVFITGFAYKGHPENDDTRDSLTISLVEELKKLGFANIFGHDFVVDSGNLNAIGIDTCSIEEGFNKADCVVFANNHQSYGALDIENLILKLNKNSIVIDCWHNFDPEPFRTFKDIVWWCWY